MSKAAFAAHELKAGDTISYKARRITEDESPKLITRKVLKEDLGTGLFVLFNTLPLYEVANHRVSDSVFYEITLVEIIRKPKWYISILNKLRSLHTTILKGLRIYRK